MHKRTFLTKLTSLVALVALGAGLWQLTIVMGEGNPPDPGAGLTVPQRDATYAKLRIESAQKQQAWSEEYFKGTHDYRKMERTSIMAAYATPPLSLKAATNVAESIVYGSVKSVQFAYDEGAQGPVADVTFTIEQSSKGTQSVGQDIHIQQIGGPFMNYSANEVMLGQDDPDPLLLPGDKAVLFLTDSGNAAVPWKVEYFTGQYRIGPDNTISPVESNPFASSVVGQSVSAFLAQAKATANS